MLFLYCLYLFINQYMKQNWAQNKFPLGDSKIKSNLIYLFLPKLSPLLCMMKDET